jgi:hypothetical protein
MISIPRWSDERAVELLAESDLVSAEVEEARRRSAEPKVVMVGTFKDALRRAPKTSAKKPGWAETYEFITSILYESISRRRRRGRPRMSDAERRKASPVHDAADEVAPIIAVLARLYPERAPAEVRRRAIEVAAARRGVDPETLLRYVSRARKDRHRIPTAP